MPTVPNLPVAAVVVTVAAVAIAVPAVTVTDDPAETAVLVATVVAVVLDGKISFSIRVRLKAG